MRRADATAPRPTPAQRSHVGKLTDDQAIQPGFIMLGVKYHPRGDEDRSQREQDEATLLQPIECFARGVRPKAMIQHEWLHDQCTNDEDEPERLIVIHEAPIKKRRRAVL